MIKPKIPPKIAPENIPDSLCRSMRRAIKHRKVFPAPREVRHAYNNAQPLPTREAIAGARKER